jgi:hypothetical protein
MSQKGSDFGQEIRPECGKKSKKVQKYRAVEGLVKATSWGFKSPFPQWSETSGRKQGQVGSKAAAFTTMSVALYYGA